MANVITRIIYKLKRETFSEPKIKIESTNNQPAQSGDEIPVKMLGKNWKFGVEDHLVDQLRSGASATKLTSLIIDKHFGEFFWGREPCLTLSACKTFRSSHISSMTLFMYLLYTNSIRFQQNHLINSFCQYHYQHFWERLYLLLGKLGFKILRNWKWRMIFRQLIF